MCMPSLMPSCFFLKLILSEKVAQSKGILFTQIVHDGGTLASKRKYQGMGIQLIDLKWRTNHVVCTGFLRSFDGTNQGVSSLLTSSFKERTGILLSSVIGRSRQDAAAKGKYFLLYAISSATGVVVRASSFFLDVSIVLQLLLIIR
jgi:hypothetical protein